MPKKPATSSARAPGRKTKSRSRNPRSPSLEADVELKALRALFDLKPPNRRYTGRLKVPIVRTPKLTLILRGPPEEQTRLGQEENPRIVGEQVEKLFLLLDHFKIPPKSPLRWFHLAFHLAKRHVPGVEVIEGLPAKRGPKGARKGAPSREELILAVTQVKLERGHGTADAIRILRKRDPDRWGRFSARNLQNRFSKYRRELVSYSDGGLLDNLGAMPGAFKTNDHRQRLRAGKVGDRRGHWAASTPARENSLSRKKTLDRREEQVGVNRLG